MKRIAIIMATISKISWIPESISPQKDLVAGKDAGI
jgi:hypothetical protein